MKKRYSKDPQALQRVLGRIQPFTPDELLQLNMPPRLSYEALKTGKGEEDDFHTLAAVVNVCLVAGEKIGDECVEAAKAAQDALMRSLARNKLFGRWGLDGPAIQDLSVALEIHEQLLSLSTPSQMQGYMAEVIKRMNAGETISE